MIALCALGAGAAACSKSADPPPASTAPPAAAAAEISSASGSVIGQGPAPGSAGAVVVVLEPTIARTFPLTGEKPVMDQAGLAETEQPAGLKRIARRQADVPERCRH